MAYRFFVRLTVAHNLCSFAAGIFTTLVSAVETILPMPLFPSRVRDVVTPSGGLWTFPPPTTPDWLQKTTHG